MSVTVANPQLALVIGGRELDTCRRYARQAEIGGRSNIREQVARMEEIGRDQLVGQIGTLALAKWLKGTSAGHHEYALGRQVANRAPTVGDGGADIVGSNIDVKTSLCRYPGKALSDYNLVVRPREWHAGQVYVLALVEAPLECGWREWTTVIVHLMGWATAEQLRDTGGTDERFGDASVLPAYELQPLPPFRWEF